MPIGVRNLHNLPSPDTLYEIAPELRDWLHRLYDWLETAADVVSGEGGGGLTNGDTGTAIYEPYLVFYGSESGGFAQSSDFYYMPATSSSVSALYVSRVHVEASPGTTGSAPFYFDPDSILLTAPEQAAHENDDRWLYYTWAEMSSTLTTGQLEGVDVEETTETVGTYRYQLVGQLPDRRGIFNGRIPWGRRDGIVDQDVDFRYLDPPNDGGSLYSGRITMPRAVFSATDGDENAYPPAKFNVSGASLSANTGATADALSAPPAPDVVASSTFYGGIETDGAWLYWTDADGNRRALGMHGTGAGSAVNGSGTATRLAIWSGVVGAASTTLTSDAELFWDDTQDALRITTQNLLEDADVAGEGPGLRLQSQTTNTRTIFSLMPNGTSDLADIWLFNSSSTTNNGRMSWGYDSGGAYWHISTSKAGSGTLRALILDATNPGSTLATQLCLQTSGNVGVGTTAPLAKFAIGGTSGEMMRLQPNASSNNRIGFYKSTASVIGSVGGDQSSDAIVIGDASDIRWYFKQSGHVEPKTNIAQDIGTSSFNLRDVFLRHINATGAADKPTVSTSGVGVSSATVVDGSTDTAGQVNITTDGTGAGPLTVTITFNASFGAQVGIPKVQLVHQGTSNPSHGHCETTAYSATAFTFIFICRDDATGAVSVPHAGDHSFSWHVIGSKVAAET